MANEAQLRVSLNIRNGNLDYRSNPTAFNADAPNANGPTPGRVTALVGAGTDVDLSKITHPGGFCWIQNLDDTNFITVGIRDTVTSKFYPIMDYLPGECFPIRLSSKIGEDFHNTGTAVLNQAALHIKADTASCEVIVDAFDK